MVSSKISFLLVLVITWSISGCNSVTTPSDNHPIIALAPVTSIEILILESFPVQVNVRINGFLGDNCTTLHQITQRREENFFKIEVTTIRPAGAICAAIVTAFEEVVALDLYGLPAGTYVVDVNGVRDMFTLDVDNC